MQVIRFTEAHFAELCGWFANEAELMQWGGPDMVFPLDDAQLKTMQDESAGEPPGRWLFTGRMDNADAAHAQVALDWRHGVARLGRVAVNPRFRGQGLAIPFLSTIIGKVFAEVCMERLELNVYTFNRTAMHTYRRLGFREEGVRRSSVRVSDTRWDTAIYAMLRHEYAGGGADRSLSPR